jgi:hypothetical protein
MPVRRPIASRPGFQPRRSITSKKDKAGGGGFRFGRSQIRAQDQQCHHRHEQERDQDQSDFDVARVWVHGCLTPLLRSTLKAVRSVRRYRYQGGCRLPRGWIGGGAIILPGVSIGDDALIGAGSMVMKKRAVRLQLQFKLTADGVRRAHNYPAFD